MLISVDPSTTSLGVAFWQPPPVGLDVLAVPYVFKIFTASGFLEDRIAAIMTRLRAMATQYPAIDEVAVELPALIITKRGASAPAPELKAMSTRLRQFFRQELRIPYYPYNPSTVTAHYRLRGFPKTAPADIRRAGVVRDFGNDLLTQPQDVIDAIAVGGHHLELKRKGQLQPQGGGVRG